MKNRFTSLLLAVLTLALVGESVVAQDHGHLNIGAMGTNQNDQLIFENGGIFETGYGYVKTLIYTNAFRYAGYYQGNITLTGLAATPDHLGPVPNAAALGSQLYAQLVSVDGPTGGEFAFWESGATTPTVSLATGTTGTNLWRVSENDGSPGSDPYGHIHGRRFTATKPGIYTVGFRALDLSSNGAGSGPIHSPSDVLKVFFQADINMASVTRTGNVATVIFGGMANWDFTLQCSTNLSPKNWFDVGSTPGADALQTITDSEATNAMRSYRVLMVPSAGP
jgi:hypothetical protein